MITYRLEGGYFTQPRWARFLKRGAITGFPVRKYSPEEIAAMTEEELNKQIEADLYTDAYEEQKKKPVAYRGKRQAENLETALYLCPSCHRIGELKSEGDQLFCSCGLKLRYTEYGYLESLNRQAPPFTTIRDWIKWQSDTIEKLSAELRKQPNDKVITSDDDQSLWKIKKARRSKLAGKGRLLLYPDRMTLETAEGKTCDFPLDHISDMAIHGQMTLIFTTTEREYFELKSEIPRSALKYYELYKALTGRHSIYERKD